MYFVRIHRFFIKKISVDAEKTCEEIGKNPTHDKWLNFQFNNQRSREGFRRISRTFVRGVGYRPPPNFLPTTSRQTVCMDMSA